MIPAYRFLVQQRDYEAWKLRRLQGVTATQVRDAATPAGFETVKASRGRDAGSFSSAEMDFGRQVEGQIMDYAHWNFGVLPSDWLIAGEDPLHLATPDGLSLDHAVIAEVKTTGKDWKTIPKSYRRQVQWQLHVTGAERCLFLWQLRVPDEKGWFYMPWLEPKYTFIDRDEQTITELVSVADRLLAFEEEF